MIVALDGANKEQGLRYFNMKTSSIPDLSWTRDVVEKLLRAVEPSVEKKGETEGIIAGRAVKFEFTFSKPEPKD